MTVQGPIKKQHTNGMPHRGLTPPFQCIPAAWGTGGLAPCDVRPRHQGWRAPSEFPGDGNDCV